MLDKIFCKIGVFFFSLICLFTPLHAALSDSEEKTKIIVCDNGLEMFSYILEFVRHAHSSIELSTPFFGGKILRELLETIEKRIEEEPQLQVHILVAPMFFEERDESMIQRIERKYPKNFHVVMSMRVPALSPDMTVLNNHVKLFIVDEHYFSVGGTNLDEGSCNEGTYTPPRKPKDYIGLVRLPAGARDGDIVGRGGEIVTELRKMFFNLYAVWEEYDHTKKFRADPSYFKERDRYFEVKGERAFVSSMESSDQLIAVEKIKMCFSGPWEQPRNSCSEEYKRLLAGAKKSVTIGNLYFCPIPSLLEEFKRHVNRGVVLNLITNGVREGVSPTYNGNFCWANRIHYVPVLYGKEFRMWEASHAVKRELTQCKIYEYYVPDVLYHKKVMVVDDHILVVGSYNLGLKSDIADYELILVIESEEAVQRSKEIFAKEMALSIKVTPSEAREWYFNPRYSCLGGMQKLIHGIL